MSLTLKSTARTAKGRLTINFKDGNKSTITVWCSRSEIKTKVFELKSINGMDCEFVSMVWNGQILN